MEIASAKEGRRIEGRRRVEGRKRKNKRRAAEKEKQRNHALSHSNARGSYESRGGRNPDYCSPDYNITRTDRPTCITGDRAETPSSRVLTV